MNAAGATQVVRREAVVENGLATYYDGVASAIARCESLSARDDGGFSPGRALPALDARVESYLSASRLRMVELPSYRGRELKLLDLTGNARTRTTKTFASLVIVARAIAHVQATGERVVIVTPSSANKGTGLRDAVLRAIENGLTTPDQLRIAVVVPATSMPKLWSSALAEDGELRRRNPVFTLATADPSAVKQVAAEAVARFRDELERRAGVRTWFTLALDNYRVADAVRAFFEAEHFPPERGRVRVHAHAVSSAFGLLGYHLGRRVVEDELGADAGPHPQLFLVQHLRTPDMVTSVTGRAGPPDYRYDPASGLWVQSSCATFPQRTYDPREEIDGTFYTRQPATRAAFDELVGRYGGGGIVVSLHECLERYARLRAALRGAEIALPADPRRLREWALVMALTGVLNAIDRELLPEDAEVVVHASGTYSDGDYQPLDPHHAIPIDGVEDIHDPLLAAAGSLL